MKRSVTSKDLQLLLKRVPALWKQAEAVLKVSAELDNSKRDIRTTYESMRRAQKRLRTTTLTKKQRSKIERKLQYYDELLYYAEREVEKRRPEFSDAISRLESILAEIAEVYDQLANVQRFEHA
jgi:response regulator RpfG family c-di-GMP phosphodiesterase